MGTRDERARSVNTRIDSPAAKVRTPATRPPPVPRAADRSDERVGQTLGVWGVPSGPYLVLPFLGPSTVRDTVGLPVDMAADLIIHRLKAKLEGKA